MILAPHAYIPVITKKLNAHLVCIDFGEGALYAHNLQILEKLKSLNANPTERYYAFYKLAQKPAPMVHSEGTKLDLSLLLYESDLPPDSYYSSQALFDEIYQEKVILPSELLIGMGGASNLAASRNILLCGMELKGVGRNFGAVRLDYPHAWGGMYFAEAVTEYITSNICEYSTHLGAERTIAFGLHKDQSEKINFKANSFIIRKRSSPRVSQSVRHFEDEQSRNTFLSITKLDRESVENHIKQLTFQYFSSCLLGMLHMSLITENAVMNGKFIDTGAINMGHEMNKIHGTLILSFNGHCSDQFSSLGDLVKFKDLDFSVENNSLKNYFEVLLKTFQAFELQKDDYVLNAMADKNFILETIKEVLLQMGLGAQAIQTIANLVNLPHKKKLTPDMLPFILSQLGREEIQVTEMKQYLLDQRTIFKINFSVKTGIVSKPIVNAFNKEQTHSFEKFILSFSRMVELVDMHENKLFNLLNEFVLGNIKLLPISINSAGVVGENVRPHSQLKSSIMMDAEAYYCFVENANGAFIKIRLTPNQLVTETRPVIIYGFDFFRGEEKMQQVIKPMLFATS